MTYLKDFQERISNKDYPSFLRLWEEYCYSDEPDGEELRQILQETRDSILAPSLGHHVERALPLWRTIQDPNLSHEIIKLIIDLQVTNTAVLRELSFNYLKAKYEHDPYFNQKIRLVGLKTKDGFQGAIRNFELLHHMAKGKFVFHTSGWGTGEIIDASLLREEVTSEFDLVVGLKTLSFENAFKTLMPLSDDHFLSRRFGNPDLLEKEAKENPLKLITCLLKDLGPKTALEIKDELHDLVIPAKEWNKWWQTTRAKIKKDTKIDTPTHLNKPFILRKEELSHEMALYKALEAKPTIEKMIQMLYSFLRDFPETLKNNEFKTSLDTRLKEAVSSSEIKDAHKLQILFFLEDLSGSKDKTKIEQILLNCNSVIEFLEDVEILAFKKRVLLSIKNARKDWKEIFFDLLYQIQSNFLRDYVFQELEKNADNKKLTSKLSDLLIRPISYPEVFVWYFQKILQKKDSLPFSDKDGVNRFFEGLLIILDHIGQNSEQRDLVKKILQAITANRYKLVREIMGQASLEEVKEYLLLATKCESLTDHDIKIIHSLAEVAHPSLKGAVKDQDKDDEQILWATEQGYLKLKNRIEHIATVETIQNAREIEAARELGDLKENAEYKAAQEKRARLQSELKLLSDQLNKARIISETDIVNDKVGAGNVVTCLDREGKKLTFTLLGPFDANPEENILSLQSKLARSMIGKAIGEKFQFQNEEFMISSIKSFFDQ